jgi:hypothetical protein
MTKAQREHARTVLAHYWGNSITASVLSTPPVLIYVREKGSPDEGTQRIQPSERNVRRP